MKTKFILHGGGLKIVDKRNDSFFKELLSEVNDGDEVLFIGFARRDEENRLEIYERDKGYICAQTNKNIVVTNATYDNLIEQINTAKAIFITGGESPLLVEDIKGYPDFRDAINGKVVAGCSAGACLFSKYYFSRTEVGVLEGLGLLPIRFMCHYGNPKYGTTEESLELLKTFPEELELVVTEECEWVVKEVDL